MARIQILELPTIYRDEGPDETPFVLVIDQVEDIESVHAFLADPPGLKDQLGARAILVFDERVEIPANETPVDPNGYPLKIRVEGDFETFHQQVQDEIRKAEAEILDRRQAALDGQRLAQERTGIAHTGQIFIQTPQGPQPGKVVGSDTERSPEK
ncbi:hypothetical protein ABZ725_14510 [Streptomyces sp. NPDC006872]|uniref:hypothetical protein n=1 Tax=Streptomyces sp. NPDC006872 TaxID=3155720 RepID=UPI0033FE290F